MSGWSGFGLTDDAVFTSHRGEMILGDGGMATMLQAAGLPLGEWPHRWNLDHPDRVAAVHAAYAAAGARWVQTNTFGAARPALAAQGLAEQVVAVNQAAVRCARAGAPGVAVLGCLGPTGAADPGAWEALYAEQVRALAEAGVDGFIVETILSLAEGAAAVRAAKTAGVVFASYTPGPDGALLDGTSPEEAARSFTAAGAAVVGVNCGSGPESLLEPARRLVREGRAPVLVAPNAGLPVITGSAARYDLSPDAFARAAIQFQKVGVRLFGGCCGTTPDHLRAAAGALASPPLTPRIRPPAS